MFVVLVSTGCLSGRVNAIRHLTIYYAVACYSAVDVSGSMGGMASIPGAENSGLSLLDITKHALKTVIASLKDIDRISLVSYSNAAKVVCALTPMTSAGKSRVLSLVDTLEADGMTNLWDGLKKGLDTLTEAGAGSAVRNAVVFLLTGRVSISDRYHYATLVSYFFLTYCMLSDLQMGSPTWSLHEAISQC